MKKMDSTVLVVRLALLLFLSDLLSHWGICGSVEKKTPPVTVRNEWKAEWDSYTLHLQVFWGVAQQLSYFSSRFTVHSCWGSEPTRDGSVSLAEPPIRLRGNCSSLLQKCDPICGFDLSFILFFFIYFNFLYSGTNWKQTKSACLSPFLLLYNLTFAGVWVAPYWPVKEIRISRISLRFLKQLCHVWNFSSQQFRLTHP